MSITSNGSRKSKRSQPKPKDIDYYKLRLESLEEQHTSTFKQYKKANEHIDLMRREHDRDLVKQENALKLAFSVREQELLASIDQLSSATGMHEIIQLEQKQLIETQTTQICNLESAVVQHKKVYDELKATVQQHVSEIVSTKDSEYTATILAQQLSYEKQISDLKTRLENTITTTTENANAEYNQLVAQYRAELESHKTRSEKTTLALTDALAHANADMAQLDASWRVQASELRMERDFVQEQFKRLQEQYDAFKKTAAITELELSNKHAEVIKGFVNERRIATEREQGLEDQLAQSKKVNEHLSSVNQQLTRDLHDMDENYKTEFIQIKRDLQRIITEKELEIDQSYKERIECLENDLLSLTTQMVQMNIVSEQKDALMEENSEQKGFIQQIVDQVKELEQVVRTKMDELEAAKAEHARIMRIRDVSQHVTGNYIRDSIQSKETISNLKTTIAHLEELVAERDVTITEWDEKCIQLTNAHGTIIAQYEETFKNMESEQKKAYALIATLRREIDTYAGITEERSIISEKYDDLTNTYNRCLHEHEILTKSLADARTTIDELRTQLSNKETRLRKVTETADNHKATFEKLEVELGMREEDCTQVLERLSMREKTIVRLEQSIKELYSELNSLRVQYRDTMEENSRQSALIENLQSRIASFGTETEQLARECDALARFRDHHTFHLSEIARLQQENADSRAAYMNIAENYANLQSETAERISALKIELHEKTAQFDFVNKKCEEHARKITAVTTENSVLSNQCSNLDNALSTYRFQLEETMRKYNKIQTEYRDSTDLVKSLENELRETKRKIQDVESLRRTITENHEHIAVLEGVEKELHAAQLRIEMLDSKLGIAHSGLERMNEIEVEGKSRYTALVSEKQSLQRDHDNLNALYTELQSVSNKQLAEHRHEYARLTTAHFEALKEESSKRDAVEYERNRLGSQLDDALRRIKSLELEISTLTRALESEKTKYTEVKVVDHTRENALAEKIRELTQSLQNKQVIVNAQQLSLKERVERIEHLESALTDALESKEQLNAWKNATTVKLEYFQQECTKLESQRVESAETIALLQRQHDALQQQNIAYSHTISENTHTIRRLTDVQREVERYKQLYTTLQETSLKQSGVIEQLKSSEVYYQTIIAEYRTVPTEPVTTQPQLQGIDDSIRKLQSEHELVERELVHQISDLQRTIQRHSDQIRELNGENKSLRLQLLNAPSDKIVSALEETNAKLRSDNALLNASIEEAYVQLRNCDNIRNAFDKVNQDIIQMRIRVQEATSERDDALGKMGALQFTIAQHEQTLCEYTEKLETQKKTLVTNAEELADFRSRPDLFRSKIIKLRDESLATMRAYISKEKEARAELDATTARISALETELNGLRSELSQKQSDIEQLTKAKDELKSSMETSIARLLEQKNAEIDRINAGIVDRNRRISELEQLLSSFMAKKLA